MKFILVFSLLFLQCGVNSLDTVSEVTEHNLTFRVILKDTSHAVDAIGVDAQIVYLGEDPYNIFRGSVFLEKENDFTSIDTIYLDKTGIGILFV